MRQLLSLAMNFHRGHSTKLIPVWKQSHLRNLSSNTNVKVTFLVNGNEKHVMEGEEGETLFDTVNNSYLEIDGFGACGGMAMCSTCYLTFNQQDFSKLPEKEDEEQDILDKIPEAPETSRLACQLYLSKEMQNMEICIPLKRHDLRE